MISESTKEGVAAAAAVGESHGSPAALDDHPTAEAVEAQPGSTGLIQE